MPFHFLLLASVTSEKQLYLFSVERRGPCAYVLDKVSNQYILEHKTFKENFKTATSAKYLHGSVANFRQKNQSLEVRTGGLLNSQYV